MRTAILNCFLSRRHLVTSLPEEAPPVLVRNAGSRRLRWSKAGTCVFRDPWKFRRRVKPLGWGRHSRPPGCVEAVVGAGGGDGGRGGSSEPWATGGGGAFMGQQRPGLVCTGPPGGRCWTRAARPHGAQGIELKTVPARREGLGAAGVQTADGLAGAMDAGHCWL